MVSSGMTKLGYNLILFDDCWSAKTRDANGNLQPDPERFPSGIPAIVEYLQQRGLTLGLYLCSGTETCKYGRPGSFGFFDQDAAQLAAWNVSYAKFDYCHHPDGVSPFDLYSNISRAFLATGHPFTLSACEWGRDNPWTDFGSIFNLWRATPDHLPFYSFTNKNQGQGIKEIINQFAGLSGYAGPGGWNDADFLETLFHPTLDYTDSVTEFSFWSLVGSPLIVATDVRNMSDSKRSILLNQEVIAISQDSLAQAGDRVSNYTDGGQVWMRPLADRSLAVVAWNSNSNKKSGNLTVEISWTALGLAPSTQVSVRDLWAHTNLGDFNTAFNVSLAPHASAMYRFTPVEQPLVLS